MPTEYASAVEVSQPGIFFSPSHLHLCFLLQPPRSRQKREMAAKLAAVRTLAEDDEDDEYVSGSLGVFLPGFVSIQIALCCRANVSGLH